MKIASLLVTVLGALALLFALLERVFNAHIWTVGPTGYLRGADTLFLFALALMVGCKCCCAKPPAQS
ncbi:MAG TPA: hypothetical protein VMD31_15710 [Opitutaceae bacterium]|nr:hypothetical protein [Opitutaceae bacterium]